MLFFPQKTKMLESEYNCSVKITREPPVNRSGTVILFLYIYIYIYLKILNKILVWLIQFVIKTCQRLIYCRCPGLYCSRSWDGQLCWDDTPAGTYASQNCPGYLFDLNTTGEAGEVFSSEYCWRKLCFLFPLFFII